MKLSFSTRGLSGYSWKDLTALAREMNFSGIEVYDINSSELNKPGSVFDLSRSPLIRREMIESSLCIPCIDTTCAINDSEKEIESASEILRAIELADAVGCPNVRIRANRSHNSDDDEIASLIAKVLPIAEEKGVCLLIETVGVFADTSRLKALLDRFASDNLGALWDLHHPARAGESASQTVRNLGAYIKHVHIKDSREDKNGELEFCLVGDGTLPIASLMEALNSVSYNGYISLEWDPEWMKDVPDIDLIFLYFTSYMKKFMTETLEKKNLPRTRDGKGRYVFEKEALIDLTFPKLLDRMVEEFPDQLAFKYTTLDYTRTYAQFRDDVDEFARALISLGVKAGTHVAIWATNVPQWYISFWAVTKIGAVLVSVNTAYKIHEAEYLFNQSDTHTVIMVKGNRDTDYGEIMASLCPELESAVPGKPLHCRKLPMLRNIITIGFEQKGCLTWEEAFERRRLVPREEVARLASAVKVGDVANMQYTSGTTGFPKGVMLTHYNVVNDGKCIGDRMELSTADRMMIQVPMFHCFGMVLAMTAAMTHGTTLLPLPYFSAKAALACIDRERITCFHGVPTMFISIMQHEDFAKTDFSYMRTGIMAGSNCPPELMREAAKPDKINMKYIVSVYGQTEASPGCTMSSIDDSLDVRTNTVGSAFPHVECKIVDPVTGEDLPDGENGEFVARGYNVMKGYYKMPDETAKTIDADGWLHTGDLACRDENGNYRITGRLKDMIIRGGENIYPREIEEFLYTNEKVRDVQVIGVPDEQYGEEIDAWIVLKEGMSATEDEIKAFVAASMARHKVPRYVTFVDDFPMNAAGKIQKYKMREIAIEKRGLKK